MKFVIIALIGNITTVTLSKPLIHPDTGLAITTSGQHWYGQPPLAMAQDEKENLNLDSKAFRGPGNLFPLNPSAYDGKAFGTAFPVTVNFDGYTAPEKVHTLSPEVHMEYNNEPSQYKFPRTAFYVQTGSNQDKLEKLNRFENASDKEKSGDIGATHYDPWVHDFVKANVPAVPAPCRAINDKGDLPAACAASVLN